MLCFIYVFMSGIECRDMFIIHTHTHQCVYKTKEWYELYWLASGNWIANGILNNRLQQNWPFFHPDIFIKASSYSVGSPPSIHISFYNLQVIWLITPIINISYILAIKRSLSASNQTGNLSLNYAQHTHTPDFIKMIRLSYSFIHLLSHVTQFIFSIICLLVVDVYNAIYRSLDQKKQQQKM